MRLSIIVPTRRFTDQVAARLEIHRQLFPAAELIVVEPADALPGDVAQDGFPLADPLLAKAVEPVGNRAAVSASASEQIADAGIERLHAQRGRGTQCNAGAARAKGRLLLFLHDDTALPAEAPGVIETAFADPAAQVACFRLRFDHDHWLLDRYAFFSRFDSALTSFGDQGILIRRDFFAAIGGFPDWPLFEYVDLLSRARRRTRIKKLPAVVTTSAVRFLENGILRQQLLNAELMLRFSLGASPESLRRRYEARRPSSQSN